MPDIRIALPEEVHAKLKSAAAMTRQSLADLVREIVREYLERAGRK